MKLKKNLLNLKTKNYGIKRKFRTSILVVAYYLQLNYFYLSNLFKLKIMEKKPSSIEWLVDQFKEYDFSEEDGMYLIKITSWLLAEKEEQAKAMHKKEVKESYREGRSDQQSARNQSFYHRNAEQYYNETFGGNNE
jgi:hypothetical protein